MRPPSRRFRAAVALSAALALLLTGCIPSSEVVEGSSVTVALGESFNSYNPNTAYGSSAETNRSIVAATNSSFVSYDATPKLVKDESFGSYRVVSESPLVVNYTIRDGVRWSDGTPVDAADLLLAWAANSTSLNDEDFDPTPFVDADDQFSRDFPRDVVYFDGFTGNGLQLVTKTPVIGADGRSITMTFDEYFADWELVFNVGLPAHVVAAHALRPKEGESAKDAVVAAIQTRDHKALAALSRFWNSGFNLSETPDDADLLVSNGPYTITEIAAGERMTLVANPEYRGEHLPQIEKLTIRFISDPLHAVAALQDGEVDIIAPQATADVLAALAEVDGASVERGFSGTGERLDLQSALSKNGQMENPLLREAFLKVVPREQILDTLIRPLAPGATLRSSQVFLPGAKGYAGSVKANGSRAFARVDIAGAKRLLARAAQESPALANPTVCLLFDPANPRRVAEFQLIQDSAAQAGIQVTNCSSPDWRNLLGTPHSYDAALYALRETNLALAGVQAAFSSTGINNHSHYANAEVDALLAEAASPVSAGERISLLSQVDAILWEDIAGAPLYQFPTVTAFTGGVTGIKRSALEPTALWNPWRWKPAPAQ